MPESLTPSGDDTLDALASDLQRLRSKSGDVPYGEITARIERQRLSEGLSPAAARVGRSSVYDAFRAGRSRINADLVAEIVLALGRDEAVAREWRSRCLRAIAAQRPAPARATRATMSRALDPVMVRTAFAVLLMVSCLGLNLFGHNAAGRIPVTLYLDMIGTAITAIVLGPWYGVAVGVATNTLAAISNVPGSILFVLVQATGALVWGYGVRAWRLGRTPLRYVLLNVIAALACSIAAVPIIVILFGGLTDHPADVLTASFEALGEGLWAAVFSSNVLVSLADKLLAGAVALAVLFFVVKRFDLRLVTKNPPQMWFSRDEQKYPR